MRYIVFLVLPLVFSTSAHAFEQRQIITGKQLICQHWSDLNKIIAAEKHGEDGSVVFAKTPSCDTLKFTLRMGRIYNSLTISSERKFVAVKAWSITGVKKPFYLMLPVNAKNQPILRDPDIEIKIPNSTEPKSPVPSTRCPPKSCLS